MDESVVDAAGGEGEAAPVPAPAAPAEIEHTPKKSPDHDLNKETIGDILIDQLEAVAKTTERRSSQPRLTAKVLIFNSRINHITDWQCKQLANPKKFHVFSSPHKVLNPSQALPLLVNLFFHLFPLQTAQSLLRNPNGQYSSFDMAQYVFWTGDETGVARAVEELIDENLVG